MCACYDQHTTQYIEPQIGHEVHIKAKYDQYLCNDCSVEYGFSFYVLKEKCQQKYP